ncbi:MAG TPA: hypothetical protein VHW66_21480 [Stellaceae bacterium]|nr:hypothetical protein [Stellaceae bacterium]
MAEFAALIATKLGHPVEQSVLERLLVIQGELRRNQAQLIRWLDTGEIRPEQYPELLNRALREAMAQCRTALGQERFKTVFGKLGKHPEALGDPDIFMEQFSSEPEPARH